MKINQHILISGANGFLAQSLRNQLSQQGYAITSLARTPLKNLKQNEKFILCNLENNEYLYMSLLHCRFDTIIHCASLQPGNHNSLCDYFYSNVMILKNLLNVITLFPNTKFILFSSAAVYGNRRFQKLNENTLPFPTTDYALSKLMAEHTVRMHTLQKSFSAICFRLPSLHGNNQKGGLINTFYETIYHDNPLEIYSNGDLKRNIMSFDDVAKVCGQILSLNICPGFHLFQLGNINTLSMKAIAQYMINKMGSKSILKCIDQRAQNEADWDFDLRKAINEIHFLPITVEASLDAYITAEMIYEKHAI